MVLSWWSSTGFPTGTGPDGPHQTRRNGEGIITFNSAPPLLFLPRSGPWFTGRTLRFHGDAAANAEVEQESG